MVKFEEFPLMALIVILDTCERVVGPQLNRLYAPEVQIVPDQTSAFQSTKSEPWTSPPMVKGDGMMLMLMLKVRVPPPEIEAIPIPALRAAETAMLTWEVMLVIITSRLAMNCDEEEFVGARARLSTNVGAIVIVTLRPMFTVPTSGTLKLYPTIGIGMETDPETPTVIVEDVHVTFPLLTEN